MPRLPLALSLIALTACTADSPITMIGYFKSEAGTAQPSARVFQMIAEADADPTAVMDAAGRLANSPGHITVAFVFENDQAPVPDLVTRAADFPEAHANVVMHDQPFRWYVRQPGDGTVSAVDCHIEPERLSACPKRDAPGR